MLTSAIAHGSAWGQDGTATAVGAIAEDGASPNATGATESANRAATTRPAAVAKIRAGVYTMKSSAGKLRLAVAGGSWGAGANVKLAHPKDTVAQKFRIRPASGSYYRITMALSGTALASKAKGRKATGAVRTARATAKSSQLWKARKTAAGTVFVNKASGGVLGASGKAHAGANVRVTPIGSGTMTAKFSNKAKAWKLARANVKRNVKQFPILKRLVETAPSGGNRTVKVDAHGTSYKMGKVRKRQLSDAMGAAWRNGNDIGFVLVDLDTGVTVSCGADRGNHGASTAKAAYVTYLFQRVYERGGNVDASAKSLMAATIGSSSNEAYLALRSRYGTAGFASWLGTVGLAHLAGEPFPRLTARNLALMWTKIYSYEHSESQHVGEWRHLFNHSYYSFVREQLGRSNTVYSKPGWYPRIAGYAALNDAAIVKRRNGRSYLLAVLSNTSCFIDRPLMRNVAKALDAVAREMPRA